LSSSDDVRAGGARHGGSAKLHRRGHIAPLTRSLFTGTLIADLESASVHLFEDYRVRK
jgi:hypothetical protein